VKEKLEKIIRSVQRSSVIVPNLTNGGCGAFAFMLAKNLKTLGIGFQIRGSNFMIDNKNVIAEMRKSNAPFIEWRDSCFGGINGHIFLDILIDDEVWRVDAKELMKNPSKEEVPSFPSMTIYNGEIRLDELESSFGPSSFWNPMFDWSALSLLENIVRNTIKALTANPVHDTVNSCKEPS
jgi:hypothetical protein